MVRTFSANRITSWLRSNGASAHTRTAEDAEYPSTHDRPRAASTPPGGPASPSTAAMITSTFEFAFGLPSMPGAFLADLTVDEELGWGDDVTIARPTAAVNGPPEATSPNFEAGPRDAGAITSGGRGSVSEAVTANAVHCVAPTTAEPYKATSAPEDAAEKSVVPATSLQTAEGAIDSVAPPLTDIDSEPCRATSAPKDAAEKSVVPMTAFLDDSVVPYVASATVNDTPQATSLNTVEADGVGADASEGLISEATTTDAALRVAPITANDAEPCATTFTVGDSTCRKTIVSASAMDVDNAETAMRSDDPTGLTSATGFNARSVAASVSEITATRDNTVVPCPTLPSEVSLPLTSTSVMDVDRALDAAPLISGVSSTPDVVMEDSSNVAQVASQSPQPAGCGPIDSASHIRDVSVTAAPANMTGDAVPMVVASLPTQPPTPSPHGGPNASHRSEALLLAMVRLHS